MLKLLSENLLNKEKIDKKKCKDPFQQPVYNTSFFPNLKMRTLHTSGHRFFAFKSWEFGNSSTHYSTVDDLFLILVTCLVNNVWTLWREKLPWSLLRSERYNEKNWLLIILRSSFQQLNIISASVLESFKYFFFENVTKSSNDWRFGWWNCSSNLQTLKDLSCRKNILLFFFL